MKESFSVGEIVQSLAGHDKENLFVIIKICGEYVYLADGKSRKFLSPKRKKIKHIKKVCTASKELVEQIESGKSIGNQRLQKAIKLQNKKQED